MQKVVLLFCTLLIAGSSALGQTKAVQTAVIKTPTALCEQCKKRIEGYVKPYDGMLEIMVNFRKGETRVKFINDRINIEEIKAYIANCGYDADDVPATEDAYQRLPVTCKKPEDGGGHPKPKPAPPPQQ